MQQIEEDILIVGGGPTGGFLAYVFASKYNFSVRVIERLPDLNDPTVEYHDRSGVVSGSYRADKVYHKYGLGEEYRKILNPADHMTFVVQDMMMDIPFIPGKKVFFYPYARRNITGMLNTSNEKLPNVRYEYQTKVEQIDLESHTIETTDLKTNEKQTRKFKFIFGADGYNSKVRNDMDKQIVKDRKLPEGTEITKCVENLLSTWNYVIPDYAGYLKMQEEAKEGKYPWYDKLDDKFKKGHRKLCGKYIMDPSSLNAYGQQNLLGFMVPYNDGTMNLCIGLPRERKSISDYLERHPEFKNNWRINPEFNTNAEDIKTEEQAHEFFATHFPLVYGLTPNLVEQWKSYSRVFCNYTVYCDNWYYNGDVCLFGDSCEGITFVSGNGLNAAMENMDQFFQILDKQTENDPKKFLSDANLRQSIFKAYQDHCYGYTRALQISDEQDAVLPSLAQAQHPKAMLFNALEATLFEKADGIYNNKINFQFFSQENFHNILKKVDIFKKYAVDKLENADKIEDMDLSNCRQELIDLLEKANLPIEYTLAPEATL